MIIGLGHRKRVGKDTIAKILAEQFELLGHPTSIVSFAAALKQAAYLIYGDFGVKSPGHYIINPGDKEEFLPLLGMTYRGLLIKMGCAHREISENTWVYPVINAARSDPKTIAIVTDVRFPNEANMILENNGYLIKVVRPQVEATDDPADVALAGWQKWHYTFMNDSNDLDALTKQVLNQLVVGIVTGTTFDG